jgi:hypothetical protein
MKNLLTRLLVLTATSVFLLSCDDDDVKDPSNSKVIVQFALPELTLSENSNEKTIALNFGKPSIQDGTIEISVDTANTKYFHTSPAVVNGILLLEVKKNDASATFAITPANVNGSKQLEFRLKEVPENFLMGSQNKIALTIQDEASPFSYVDFIPVNATIKENYSEGYPIQLHLSESPTVDGSIVLEANSTKAIYGEHYVTVPAFSNGTLTLAGTPGTSVVSFTVIPVDNTIINGEFEIEFSISETLGNIQKGTTVKESFRITDDELENMPKGYEIAAGSWGLKRTVEYDALGRIDKVHIESATPAKSTHTESYFYNGAGLLEKINKYPNIDEIFTWQNDRIIKSESVDHGVVKSYTVYDYDDYGNVSGTATFYLQPGGEYKAGILFGYLYFTDGNLYKALSYAPAEGNDEPTLLSTSTYDGYIDAANPFPMVDILPTVKTQTKLPTTYRVEGNEKDLLYNLSYEFRSDGRVGKRTATGAQTTESAIYHYY